MLTQQVHDFFAENRVIVLSVYGQVFFVLGLAIAVQSWRHSRLALARSLKWLAAFGFIHAMHEWGNVFIPIQEGYMPAAIVELMVGAQVLLLAISFACLFQFGLEMLRPLPEGQQWLRFLPSAALAGFTIAAVGPTTGVSDVQEWHRLNSIWARYLMCFPGALLAAYGLWGKARELTAPMYSPSVKHALRLASFALASYAVVGGLVGPPGGFFPASWLNGVQLERITLVPVEVYRSACGLLLAVSVIRMLEVFREELDRRLAAMEEVQMLASERERIGRELHDGTVQTIYAAGLLLRSIEKDVAGPDVPQVAERLHQSTELLDQAVADLRGHIGLLRAPSSTRSLVTGLREVATARHLRSLINVEIEDNLPVTQVIDPASVGHLLAIAGEVLSNVVRHAGATHVLVSVASVDDYLRMVIRDNGRGLPGDFVTGYGLRNIRDRARMLGGEVALESEPEGGTTVTVEVPWSEGMEKRAAVDSG